MAQKQAKADYIIAEVAHEDGRRRAFGEILDYLQEKYLSDELKDPQSPEGIAILTLAREIGELIRGELDGN